MTSGNAVPDFRIGSDDPQIRFSKQALIVGLVGCAVAIAGAFLDPVQAIRSYLIGFLFWLGIALGSMGILSLHHVAGGSWSAMIRRPLEAAVRTLPLLAIFFIPVAVGAPFLYEWADPAHVAHDPILQAKQPYLNLPFFYARGALYFAAWIGLGWFLTHWSIREDLEGSALHPDRLEYLSRGALILYALTMSFAAVDWVMSLEPHWFSMVFGLLLIAAQGLAAFAFTIPVVLWLDRGGDFGRLLASRQLRDLGSFLFAFVMIWAYLGLSQLLIIWSANNPEEIPWYLVRSTGGWWWLAVFLMVFHFVIPFVVLLGRGAKSNRKILATMALWLLFCRWVELIWLVVPAWSKSGLSIHPLDIVMPVALGGIWVWWFFVGLASHPLVPLHDVSLEEASP
jgi:hypothetical protein